MMVDIHPLLNKGDQFVERAFEAMPMEMYGTVYAGALYEMYKENRTTLLQAHAITVYMRQCEQEKKGTHRRY